MAIFGRQGLEAAVLYLATLWAVYGMKDAGFKKGEEKKIEIIVARKNVKGASSGERIKSIKAMRKARYDSMIDMAAGRPGYSKALATEKYGKGSDYEEGGEFAKGYLKGTFAR